MEEFLSCNFQFMQFQLSYHEWKNNQFYLFYICHILEVIKFLREVFNDKRKII